MQQTSKIGGKVAVNPTGLLYSWIILVHIFEQAMINNKTLTKTIFINALLL
jgi:hypothetical protein